VCHSLLPTWSKIICFVKVLILFALTFFFHLST
jgi:hypothetical protein